VRSTGGEAPWTNLPSTGGTISEVPVQQKVKRRAVPDPGAKEEKRHDKPPKKRGGRPIDWAELPALKGEGSWA